MGTVLVGKDCFLSSPILGSETSLGRERASRDASGGSWLSNRDLPSSIYLFEDIELNGYSGGSSAGGSSQASSAGALG